MSKERERNDSAGHYFRVHLCFGPNCTPRGSRALLPVLSAALARAGIADRVEVLATTCRNRCDFGPSMNVYPGPVFYNDLTSEAIEDIVREHFVGGKPVERWIYQPPTSDSIQAALDRLSF